MPQLRIHFTDVDLARTRLHLDIDLMWEIVGSIQALQHTAGGLPVARWRNKVRQLIAADTHLRAALPALKAVAPEADYFPDFLTPAPGVPDFDAGIETVMSTSSRRLREEIGRLRPTGGPARRWLTDLARSESGALRHLRNVLRVYYQRLVAPELSTISNGLHVEVADGIQHYLKAGPDGLLRWLGRSTAWQPPVLTVEYPEDRTLDLQGRGLLLVPSYFCVNHPVALANPQLHPTLVFPIRTEARLLAGGHGGDDHVSALLGPTRAAILRSVVNSSTTTTLARRTGVTRATVSHHTYVLRQAGLIITERHRNYAMHRITTLGLKVLKHRP